MAGGFVEGNGVRLHCVDAGGPGRPVVFLHGAMEHGGTWRRVVEGLGPGFRSIVLDQRGHGRSDKPASGYAREDYVRDLERAVDALGLERFALVGHSTGGLNAWVYAARHPERVSALVIEDMHASRQGAAYLADWRRWLGEWPLPFASADAVRAYFASLRPALGELFVELFEKRADGWWPLCDRRTALATIEGNDARDWWDDLAAVRCPALLVAGGDSNELSREEAQRMVETLRDGTLVVVEGASHTVHFDRPARFIEAVGGFLRQERGA